jgi:acyl-coenzyme A thioesterase PaaI-like protein
VLIREPALWRDIPVRGEFLDSSASQFSGLEALRRVRAAPPMGRLTGLTFDSEDAGTAAFSLPVSAWFEWSHGGVPGGTLALAADAAFGCALQTLQPSHTQYTTSELSMTYLRSTANRIGDHGNGPGHPYRPDHGPIGGRGCRRQWPARRIRDVAYADLPRPGRRGTVARGHCRTAFASGCAGCR